MYYYNRVKNDKAVIQKLNQMVSLYPTRGFDEYYGRIRAQGYKWNRKRVLRVYRQMKLQLRKKRKRKFPLRTPKPLAQPNVMNDTWSMDFMTDSLESGRRFRVLNIIDDYNREAIWIDAQFSYTSEKVRRALEILEIDRGLPKSIRVDNGPEFISNTLKEFMEKKGVKLCFIQPGKPTQNAYVERFNRLFREDVLDAYLFKNIEQVRTQSDSWRTDYNDNHPHKSLGRISPNQFKSLFNKEINSSDTVKVKVNGSKEPTFTVSPQLMNNVYQIFKPKVLT